MVKCKFIFLRANLIKFLRSKVSHDLCEDEAAGTFIVSSIKVNVQNHFGGKFTIKVYSSTIAGLVLD